MNKSGIANWVKQHLQIECPIFCYDLENDLLYAAILFNTRAEFLKELEIKLKAKYNSEKDICKWIARYGHVYCKDPGAVMWPDGKLADI